MFQKDHIIQIGLGGSAENFAITAVGIAAETLFLQLNGALANTHDINAPVTLANLVTRNIVAVDQVSKRITLDAAIVPANYPLGGANPPVLVRQVNTELAVIKSLDGPANSIRTAPLAFPHANGTALTGGLTPHYSHGLGSGRLDAYEAVKEARNYDHDRRDLMIRNSMADDGKAATDPAETAIDSPDIWAVNQAAVLGNVAHGAANTPANAQTSGRPLHQKPRRSVPNIDFYVRIFNRGIPASTSFDYSVHVYLALKDVDMADPLWIDDYMDGPTTATPYNYFPFSTPDPLSGANTSFNLNHNAGNGDHPGSRNIGNHNSRAAAYSPGRISLPLIAGNDGRIYIANLGQADRPRLPHSYVTVRTSMATTAADTAIRLEHTRGLVNGQQILIGRPGDPNYRVATINAAPDAYSISIIGTVGNVYPSGTLVVRLEAVQTTLSALAPAAAPGEKFSSVSVASLAGFKCGNHVMSGPVQDVGNRFHRIVRIVENTAPAVNQLIIAPPLGGAGLANGCLLTQLGGRVQAFVLAEVTPHDGILAGNRPENNNNISYKEITFGHQVSFTDATGALDLVKRIQVAKGGAILSTDFRIVIEDADGFVCEEVIVTITRKLNNGAYEAETYYYKSAAPAAWELTPAAPAWLDLHPPREKASNLAATGNQTDIYFEGNFKANKEIDEVRMTVNIPGNDPMGGRDFITSESFLAKIFTVADLPDLSDPRLQTQTGMPALAGTQMLHAFADMRNLAQTGPLAFGPLDENRFRLTSSFGADPAASVNAYAVVDGIVFIQRNVGYNTINLVIKPLKQAEIGFNRVRYFIYRGLREDDFFTVALPDNLIANAARHPRAHFVDSVIATQHALHPGAPVLLSALGWDNQALDDTLDDFFFNSAPNRQLPVVKRGMTLGRFKNQEFGFEIVLAEGAYPIALRNLRENQTILDVGGIANADEKAARREDILNYIDPAAYYGMHTLSGILCPVFPDPNPDAIDTLRKDKSGLYDAVVAKFFTKNTLYIDVRNENGYSYNYYGNYTQVSGSDLGKAIRLGFAPPARQALTTSTYATREWPIMIVDNSAAPESNPENMSAVYMQLSTADNGNPIVFFEYGNVLSRTTDNNYTEGGDLLETCAIVAIDPLANRITVDGNVAALTIGAVFYVIGCAHEASNAIYKLTAKASNAVNNAHTDLSVEANTLAYVAAVVPVGAAPMLGKIHFNNWTKVIAISHPNHAVAPNSNQKLNIAHVLKLRYFRQRHETGKAVIGINQANRQFTLAGLIPRLLTPGDRIVLTGAGTNNNGCYTIAANGVLQVGANTQISVVEAIPAALSAAAGVGNGSVKIKPGRVPAQVHYTDHKFGSLNAITRQFKITNITVTNASQAVITIGGDYLHVLTRNTRLSIVNASSAANNGSYAMVGTPTLNAGNTAVTIAIATGAALSSLIVADPGKDLIAVIALPWRSDMPTQWIAGFDLRYMDARRQLTDAADVPKDGFAYMGQTGVAIEQDRIVFHMTPLNFFKVPTRPYSPNVINMHGGTSSKQSFWQVMQAQNQALVLNACMLRIDPGSVIVRVFDFVDDTADAIADDPIKSNFLSLCLTRTEFQRLKETADAQLNNLHDLTLVLRREKRETDLNGVNYRTFEVAVSGYARKADNSLVAYEVFPAAPVLVYALREDAVVFTSKDFSDLENTSPQRVSYEETLRLNANALSVYAANPAIYAHINAFLGDLNAISHDFPAIAALVQGRAESLWSLAVAGADTGGTKPNDDRQLYWARLHARNAIGEHATLKNQFHRRKRMMQLFEERSRGFHTSSFAAAPAGAVKILLIGYDPFKLDGGNGGNPRQSNPSGAVALRLHGKTISKLAKQGFIQSMIFPVRFGDFDAGLVERIIGPFIQGPNAVNMIITCSKDNVNYFNIDRFASKFRNPSHMDNENHAGKACKFYRVRNNGQIVASGSQGLPQFLETTLPWTAMDDTLPNDRVDGGNTPVVVFNQRWKGLLNNNPVQNALVWDPDNPAYDPNQVEVAPAINVRATLGSGGDYLSNEIFYRVALMRSLATGTVPRTGHLHLPDIQGTGSDFSQADTQTLVDNAMTIISDALSAF